MRLVEITYCHQCPYESIKCIDIKNKIYQAYCGKRNLKLLVTGDADKLNNFIIPEDCTLEKLNR